MPTIAITYTDDLAADEVDARATFVAELAIEAAQVVREEFGALNMTHPRTIGVTASGRPSNSAVNTITVRFDIATADVHPTDVDPDALDPAAFCERIARHTATTLAVRFSYDNADDDGVHICDVGWGFQLA